MGARVSATVERTWRGWRGTTSLGRAAYITDGQAWWFAEDFAENGRLSDDEQMALDRAAMAEVRARQERGQW